MVGSDYWGMGGRLQLNALPAPPPLGVGLTINDAGSVDPTTGLASVSGSIFCSRPVVVLDLGRAQTGSCTVVAHGQIRVCRRCMGD